MTERQIVAPEITNYRFAKHLGSGGFADVFLYDQLRPARRVAIKVLLAERLDKQAQERFDTEADLMAMLSNHNNIVTMLGADITQDGRPFLVMEYCPRPNLGIRYKREPFGVVEALSTGIQISAAVETVHRAGILHRDIKPANILVTEYDRPVLTDFGISVASGDMDRAEGLSIPWSPPEAIVNPGNTGVAADVYSLAATIYTLLAGRHPFEVPGGDNRQHALIGRIESAPLPKLGRADVPATFEQVLATAMAKSADSRYQSALALARALQQVQVELQLPETPIEISRELSEDDADRDEDDEPGTRIRSVTAVDPTPQLPSAWGGTGTEPRRTMGVTASHPPAPVRVPTSPAPGSGGYTTSPGSWAQLSEASASEPDPADTVYRVAVPQPEVSPTAADPRRRQLQRTLWVLAAVVLVGGAIGLAVVLGNAEEPETSEPVTTGAAPVDPLGAIIPPVESLEGEISEVEVTFGWENTEPEAGDVYLWQITQGSDDPGPTNTGLQAIDTEELAIPLTSFADDAAQLCIEVTLRRADGRASEPTEECVSR